jgi:hypothetical protein
MRRIRRRRLRAVPMSVEPGPNSEEPELRLLLAIIERTRRDAEHPHPEVHWDAIETLDAWQTELMPPET